MAGFMVEADFTAAVLVVGFTAEADSTGVVAVDSVAMALTSTAAVELIAAAAALVPGGITVEEHTGELPLEVAARTARARGADLPVALVVQDARPALTMQLPTTTGTPLAELAVLPQRRAQPGFITQR